MNLIKRIRIWLQKPWFVGVLSVIAILFSFRNIVLPLMDLSSANQQLGQSGGGAASGTAGLLLPGGEESVAVREVDRLALRKDFFAGREYRRNPFMLATDPRQPGYRARPAKLAEIEQKDPETHFVSESGSLSPQQLFVLKAILVREGQQYALINRQVADVGDVLVPDHARVEATELTGVDQRQLQGLLAAEYSLKKIGSQQVEIASSVGDFTVSLNY